LKLSIITINLNNASGLEKTIQSVINQTFTDFEYIVIDGNSTDGSVDIINIHSSKINYWVSEPDIGIYNAMNKGIRKAQGEYCLFLNSGDTLVDKNILEKVFNENLHEDIIYGNMYYNRDNGEKTLWICPDKLTFRTFLQSTLCHPASFIKKQLFFEISLYDETLKIISDWVFFIIAIVIHNKSYIHLPYCISNFEGGGISENTNKCDMEKIAFLSKCPYNQLLFQTVFELQREIEIYEQKNKEYNDLINSKLGILVKIIMKIKIYAQKKIKILMKTKGTSKDSSKTEKKSEIIKNMEDKVITRDAGMRIAIISSTSPSRDLSGGISSAHYNLFCILRENDFNVEMFTFGDNDRTQKILEQGIKSFGTPHIIIKFINMLFLIFRFFFHENLYQLQYVIISQFGSIRLSIALRKYKPDIIIIPDNGCPLLSIKKPKKARIVFVSHHNQVRFINEPLLGYHSYKEAMLVNKIERHTLKKVDVVVCPSDYMKKFFIDTHKFNDPIKVIPNIISEKTIQNITSVNLYEKINLPVDSIIIYIPSAGSIYKGGNYVFEIVRRLSNSCNGKKIGFYLSGDIDLLLMRELSFLKANVVIFAPNRVNYFDNISYIKSCSFCISPTLIESFGMAILEAGFCGLPVITFNIGGTSDIIIDGNNGFLINFLDIEKLIQKANLLLTNNELLMQMQNNSKKIAMERFASNIILEQYKNIFEQLHPPTKDFDKCL